MHPFSYGSEPLVLCAAAPLEGNRTVLRAFSGGLLWAIPGLLAVSALGGYLLSRKALKPVDQITAATRSISVSNLSERLPVPETRDELQRLSETQNAMLARLESAVNEIKRFTGDASHELRNPVSFVQTTAELALRNRQIDAASQRAFEEIVAECRKSSRLLKDMLTLARADAGNSRLAFEPVDLIEVVKAVCQKARSLTDERGHTLTVDFEENCHALVLGDYSSLQRLIWILLDNAAKYTPSPGTIQVRLATSGENVAVTVEDNGKGISAADLPHIFERFYRADQSRSQVEGFGLGLSIAMWIANVHQASLSASSKENEGSVFKIIFPLLGLQSPQHSRLRHVPVGDGYPARRSASQATGQRATAQLATFDGSGFRAGHRPAKGGCSYRCAIDPHGGCTFGKLHTGEARGQGEPDRRLARELKQQD
jgi:signal transduction histidine kinase